MLRDLTQLTAGGAGILGTHLVGVLASDMPTGFALPGLLNNDVDAADPAGCLYKVEITSQPSAGRLAVEENGAFAFTGAPDGAYTAGERISKFHPSTGLLSTATATLSLTIGGGVVVPPPTDTAAPTATAAAVANTAPTAVVLTVSEALNGAFVPLASTFAVAGHTVSAVAVSGSAISLTVSPAFISGEVARTVSYTQPATGGARDTAGNLLASFTGRAITNNVAPVTQADSTAPTVTAAAVANAAPTSIALTASEALDPAYVPASSAFTVAGHNVTGVSVSGATIGLTVAPAFANGEAARAVAYVQPATGGARDLAGNLLASFTGRAITNNVAAPTAPENPGFIRSKTRTIKVKAAPLTFEGSRFWNLSDPRHPVGSIDANATIDISFDWNEVLADIEDTIASVYFDIAGITSMGGYYIGGFATIFVTAPTDTPRITCRITTNSVPARIEDRTVFLTIEAE